MYANPSLPVFWPRVGLSDLKEMETVCPSSGLPRLVTRTAVLRDISVLVCVSFANFSTRGAIDAKRPGNGAHIGPFYKDRIKLHQPEGKGKKLLALTVSAENG
jgi:hypothetical protein